jgi:hypothetical protein
MAREKVNALLWVLWILYKKNVPLLTSGVPRLSSSAAL